MGGLESVFGTQGHVSAWQEVARALVIFTYGYALVRLGGRRTFARWSALDIIVAIVIGSNLSRALTGSAALGGTLLATTLLVGLHWILAQAAARSEWLSRLLEGQSVIIAEGGRLVRARQVAHSVSHADIEEALHGRNLTEVGEADRIALEPSGKIQVLTS